MEWSDLIKDEVIDQEEAEDILVQLEHKQLLDYRYRKHKCFGEDPRESLSFGGPKFGEFGDYC